MSTIYAGADAATVFESLVGVSILPHLLYGVGAPYVSFPFGPGGACQFTPRSTFAGRSYPEGDEPDEAYPLLLYFLEGQPDYAVEGPLTTRMSGSVRVIVAHNLPDYKEAEHRCARDLALVREYVSKQGTLYSLTHGPFGFQSTAVVPASFGTVNWVGIPRIDAGSIKPEPQLGPTVAVGSALVTLELLVS